MSILLHALTLQFVGDKCPDILPHDHTDVLLNCREPLMFIDLA